jgi:D-aminoacyl-tRNA deacylase
MKENTIPETENKRRITIICSSPDTASQNIKGHLLTMREWEQVSCDGCDGICSVYESGNFRIVEIDELHIYQDGIDKKLVRCGLPTDLIIFASKHKSQDGRKILTAHFTGNVKDADFGGRPRELAKTAPYALRSILKTLQSLATNIDYEVMMESTHHGPSDLNIPSLYVEIGSSETQWEDPVPGEIIARAILSVDFKEVPVALGFGGGHYAPRQSKLLFETNVTFGHSFPNYQLHHIDREMFKQAFEKSDADFVYFDRKSMPSKEREKIGSIVEELGIVMLREGDIREMKGVPWEFYRKLFEKANELCLGARVKLTDGLKDEIGKNDVHRLNFVRVSQQLLQEAELVDKRGLKLFVQGQNVAYLENTNGTIGDTIFCNGDDCAEIVAQALTNECIKILKEHYEIEYIPEGNILYIIEKKFSPELARKWGVLPGPMFGELANGKSVTINGKNIKPEMVYYINRKGIILIR